MLPSFLYRGDADPQNTRQLRAVNPANAYGYLLTNLSAGGDGQAIFSTPFPDTINQHVAVGWDKTHFLSFTSDKTVAQHFATGGRDRTLEPYDGHHWDTSLTVIDTGRLNAQEIETGAYRCQYRSRSKPIDYSSPTSIFGAIGKSQDPQHSALLINVATYLKARSPAMEAAIANAMRDKEWLILPMDMPPEVNGQLTSKLESGCVSQFQTFKYTIA